MKASRLRSARISAKHAYWTIPLAVLATCLPLSAQAFCGFFAGKADASLFNEASQVVVARDGKRTVLSMLNNYDGPLAEFALVVPTPVVLKQGDVKVAEKATFERLDAYSSPRLAEYNDTDPCQVQFDWGQYARRQFLMEMAPPPPAKAMLGGLAQMRAKALGVTVEAAYTLEEYDIVSLSATKSAGLEIWLRENGYKIPKGAKEALRPYINQGMKFFVAKVNLKEQKKTGYTYLRPLQFSFESEKFMLPMRLGMLNAPPDKPQDLIVYLLTRGGRVESSNYRTVKLPANINLPPFVKPGFKDFYKALFDNSSKLEDYRAVFTEYFWDMAWCDPCSADPLSTEELRKAGAFWVTGERNVGGGQPALLTRLHLRYTPNTFPEDLMFTQTQDHQNWQTRYVVQNPYGGSVSQCNAQVASMDCEAMCKARVEEMRQAGAQSPGWFDPKYKNQPERSLMSDCQAVCRASKQAGIDKAFYYYTRDLPARVAGEKQTLARLTGWNLARIDAMPGAHDFDAPADAPHLQLVPQISREPVSLWRSPFGTTAEDRLAGVQR
jgi:hypothetical protein